MQDDAPTFAPFAVMSRKLVREIARLAWPVLIAQLAVMAYAVIDTIMAGRYATDDLAAVGIGASIYFSVFVALMGVLLAVSPIVAQLHGAGREREIGEQVRQALWLTLGLAILSVFVYRFPDPLLTLAGAPPEVEAKVRAYLAIAAWGAPAGLGFRLFCSYTTAVSRPRAMMAMNLMGLGIKIPLTWLLVLGEWGMPEMGASGCALATTLVNWLVCIAAWVWCAKAPVYRGHETFIHWSWPRWRDQRHLFGLGLPIGMTFLVDVTAFTFMALLVARLGATNSAAHQIAANVAAVMFMLPLAMGNAVGVLVGQSIGARNYGRARQTGVTGISLTVALAAMSGTTLVLASDAVASFYTPDNAVRQVAALLLVLVAAYHCFDALQVVTVNALRGYKRAVVPLVINVFGLWIIGLAGGYALGLTTFFAPLGLISPLGARGLWIGAATGMCAAALGILAFYLAISARELRHEAS